MWLFLNSVFWFTFFLTQITLVMVLIIKILTVLFMTCFLVFKDFHKLHFIYTSQLSASVEQALVFPILQLRKLKLCDVKQLPQHHIDNRWCNLKSNLGYWLQIHYCSPIAPDRIPCPSTSQILSLPSPLAPYPHPTTFSTHSSSPSSPHLLLLSIRTFYSHRKEFIMRVRESI